MTLSDKVAREIFARADAEWRKSNPPVPDTDGSIQQRRMAWKDGFVAGWIARSLEDNKLRAELIAAEEREKEAYACAATEAKERDAFAIKYRHLVKKALRLDQPWPLRDVLLKLADAAEHLLHDHTCDTDGHETIAECVSIARDIAVEIPEVK